MIKNLKINLANMTKVTLSLTTLISPMFFNSNNAKATIFSKLGTLVRIPGSGGILKSAIKIHPSTSNNGIKSLSPKFLKPINSFKKSLINFANTKIIIQEPPKSGNPLKDFANTKIITQSPDLFSTYQSFPINPIRRGAIKNKNFNKESVQSKGSSTQELQRLSTSSYSSSNTKIKRTSSSPSKTPPPETPIPNLEEIMEYLRAESEIIISSNKK